MTEKLGTWGRGVTCLLLLLMLGGAVQGMAQGSRSGGGILTDALLGTFTGWFVFGFAVVAFACGAMLVSLFSGLIAKFGHPELIYKFLKWITLIAALVLASAAVVLLTYSGLKHNRLVPAAEHFQACMLPQQRREKIYYSNTCADGWVVGPAK